MKVTEKRFEDKLIGALRDAGFFCIHPNIMNQNGFPDLLAIAGDKLALIEAKVVDKLEKPIHGYFQPTQAPFYHSYMKAGGGSLWIAFDYHGEGHLAMLDPIMVRDWKELTWESLMERSQVQWHGPVWYLATQLRQHLRGEPWTG